LARIQSELFPGIEGGAVGHLQSVVEQRFGIRDLPQGYFYLPIGSGGLELRNPMIDIFAMERIEKSGWSRSWDLRTEKFSFAAQVNHDVETYKRLKEHWENLPSSSKNLKLIGNKEFMSFDEYVSLRETWLPGWLRCYDDMLEVPDPANVMITPAVQTFLGGQASSISHGNKWNNMDWYERWVVSLYGEEVVKRFGGLEVVDPTLIPVGMVQLFRSSRMKLDE